MGYQRSRNRRGDARALDLGNDAPRFERSRFGSVSGVTQSRGCLKREVGKTAAHLTQKHNATAGEPGLDLAMAGRTRGRPVNPEPEPAYSTVTCVFTELAMKQI